ncbi:DUF3368 domain-containing protein [Haladaptatus sp. GCM10025707]|uniref:DUF3368 domain-containing protein n=1 Tax=unclassified Haladaptatus TaxID=2622732 RepID=UPI0034E957E4
MDERYGRDVAETEGMQTRGTAYLLVVLVKRGRLYPEKARLIFDSMIDTGWYCARPLYVKFRNTLEASSSE